MAINMMTLSNASDAINTLRTTNRQFS
jgi:hypothetical protein